MSGLGTIDGRPGAPWWAAVVVAAAGFALGCAAAITERWVFLAPWGAALTLLLVVSAWQFVRTRRRRPSSVRDLPQADRDRIRRCIASSGCVDDLPQHLRPVATAYAGYIDHVSSTAAPWYLAAIATHLGGVGPRAIVGPGWVTALVLPGGILMLLGFVPYLQFWRRARRIRTDELPDTDPASGRPRPEPP